MMELSKKILDILEDNGFSYGEITEQNKECYIELSQFTPAGEDWCIAIWFDGNDESFIDSFREYVESFDVDEEAELYIGMRGKHGVPSSVRELVEDAEWKKGTLGKTLKNLEDIDVEEKDKSNMITLFVLDSVNDGDMPIVYVIPLEKQLEVEKLAKSIATDDFHEAEDKFEELLSQNGIDYEWLDRIYSVTNRHVDWIDDKVPRVIVG